MRVRQRLGGVNLEHLSRHHRRRRVALHRREELVGEVVDVGERFVADDVRRTAAHGGRERARRGAVAHHSLSAQKIKRLDSVRT